MKEIKSSFCYAILAVVILLFPICLHAQTNTFPASGNTGIGTGTPQTLLDLASTVGVKQLIYGNGTGGNIGYYMGFGVNLGQAPNTLTTFIGPPGGDGTHGYASFSVASATSTWPYTSFLTRFTVLSSGNVGIGTTTPNEKLAVNGNIRAQQVKVETANWPDYVFEETYNLMPLKDLEKFIIVYKHLPEMPSAQEIETNGQNLGEINAKLLKSVEELTLHLIKKDKQIQKQQARSDNQDLRIQMLENSIADLIKKKE